MNVYVLSGLLREVNATMWIYSGKEVERITCGNISSCKKSILQRPRTSLEGGEWQSRNRGIFTLETCQGLDLSRTPESSVGSCIVLYPILLFLKESFDIIFSKNTVLLKIMTCSAED